MNKFIQYLFLILLPLFPLWAWLWITITKTPFSLAVGAGLLPLALYLVIFNRKRFPLYLIFFALFTVYHLASIFINDTFPENSSKIYFLISDQNLIACLFFIIIEHSIFDSKFLINLTKLLLVTVGISLAVSIIQIKIPGFFFNTFLDPDLGYLEENRCSSIYSWISLNSLGITFPILIAILTNVFHKRKPILAFLIGSGIIVSFLSKARYVMISCIIVLSQLFLNTRISLIKKASLVAALVAGIYFLNMGANAIGYNISDVIENRILEKENDMGSAKARIKSYEVFLIAFPENPWFGVGPETRKDVVDMLDGSAPLIHIGYLSYLYFYGIVGFLILLTAIYFLVKYAWEIGKKHNFWGAFYGLVALLVANLTFVYFNFSEMGIVVSLIYLRYFKFKSMLELFEGLAEKHHSLQKEPVLIQSSKI
jgi:O-antigen ligase